MKHLSQYLELANLFFGCVIFSFAVEDAEDNIVFEDGQGVSCWKHKNEIFFTEKHHSKSYDLLLFSECLCFTEL